jgi:hypothetical protein
MVTDRSTRDLRSADNPLQEFVRFNGPGVVTTVYLSFYAHYSFKFTSFY